jgi:hypothetical protein
MFDVTNGEKFHQIREAVTDVDGCALLAAGRCFVLF